MEARDNLLIEREDKVPENFDQVHPEDRSFILGGQTFHWQPMWWRDFGQMVEDTVKKAEEEAEAAQAAEEAKESGGTSARDKKKAAEAEAKVPTLIDTYEQLIDGICRYLEPSEVDSFRAIVNDPAKRISHLQLSELRDWLREVTNNRPTELPSPSDGGRGSTGPTLRVASS